MSDYATNYYVEQIRERLPQKAIILCRPGRRLGKLVQREEWEEVVREMVETAQALRRAGVEFVVIPSFTLHMAADAIEASGVPVIRMDDCIVAAAVRTKKRRLAILNAEVAEWKYLSTFYERLKAKGCELVPRTLMTVHTMVEFDRLTLSNQPRTRKVWKEYWWWYVEVMWLMAEGADVTLNASVEMARILGSKTVKTPLGSVGVRPVVDAVELHIKAIVKACSERSLKVIERK